MPANIITINNVSKFYVGDSKMPDLIKFLAEIGFTRNKEAEELIRDEGESLYEMYRDKVNKVAV